METEVITLELVDKVSFDAEGTEVSDRTFGVRLGSVALGMLWSGAEGCSLRWRGKIPIQDLAGEATGSIPHFMSDERQGRIAAAVTFCLKDGNVKQFALPADVRGHAEALNESATQITFARYDIMRSLNPRSYSRKSSRRRAYFDPTRSRKPRFIVALTAENADVSPDGTGELGLLLPNFAQWTPDIVRWIVRHHVSREHIEPIINFELTSETLAGACTPSLLVARSVNSYAADPKLTS